MTGPQSGHPEPLEEGGAPPSPAGDGTPPAYQPSARPTQKRILTPAMVREIKSQQWVYCTKCGTHWNKPGYPMSVTNFHLECDGDINECEQPLKCNQFRWQIGMGHI